MTLFPKISNMYNSNDQSLTFDTNIIVNEAKNIKDFISSTFKTSTIEIHNLNEAPHLTNDIISFEGTGISWSGGTDQVLFSNTKIDRVLFRFYDSTDNDPILIISVLLNKENWCFSDTFPDLQNTFWDNLEVVDGSIDTELPEKGKPAILLASSGVQDPERDIQLNTGIFFYGSFDVNKGVLRQVAWMFTESQTESALGSIQINDNNSVIIDISLLQNQTLPDLLAQYNLSLEVHLIQLFESIDQTGLRIRITTQWNGKSLHLYSVFSSENQGVLNLDAEGNLSLPSTNDLAKFFGGNDLAGNLPGDFLGNTHLLEVTNISLAIGLFSRKLEYASLTLTALKNKNLTIIPGLIEVHDLTFQFSLYNNTNGDFSFLLSGGLEISGVDFIVSSSLSSSRVKTHTIAVTLAENNTINLTQIARHFGLSGSAPDILITDLTMSASSNPSRYYLIAAIEVHHITNNFSIENLQFEIDHQRPNTLFNLQGIINIANIIVTVTANNEKGWQFTGKTEGDIPIGTLISDLATKFGVASEVPNPIGSLTFKNLATSFNTATKDFSFSGAMDFQIAGVDVDLQSQVNITHNQDGTAQKSFSGKLTLGSENPKIFDLLFNKEESSTLMLAAYHSVAGDTVSIADLLSTIGINGVPNVLSFTLKDAVLAYEKAGEEGKKLFVTHMGNGIDLSKLPLVGKYFSDGAGLTLNYQIVATSKDFNRTELDAINELLPEDISPLEGDSILSGLSIAVTMNMNGEFHAFELPVAVNDDNTPDPDSTEENPLPIPPVKATPQDDSIKWFAIQKNIGPVHFHRIGVGYTNGELKFALDASFSMGGLEISLDGLSASSPLTRFEPHFNLDGLGIDYKNKVIEIGGAFLKEHIIDPVLGEYDEYDGVVLLRMKKFSISAIGSYAYVNNEASLFIYAALNFPLGGPAIFFITGISFGFGYNRALRMPSIDKVMEFPLVAEAMSGKSLPANAGKETLMEELEAIHQYIPVSMGQKFIAIGIRFTSYKLIDSIILLTVSFGNHFEIDILGVSTLSIPPEVKKPLAMVQLAIKASFIPDEGFIGVRAQLTSASYIFSKDCHLTGGFAFYIWYKKENHGGDFVTTIGGYHPNFKKPAHYPDVPRLGINWQVDESTYIKGGIYFALCAHALMAGGSLEAVFEEGGLKAWFIAGADFLIAWKPIHYEASLYIHIGASYTFKNFGNKQITMDLGVDIDIWGPEFGGHAEVNLFVISIGVDFGASKDSTPELIDWITFNDSFLPNDNLCNVTVASGLVSKGADDKHLGIVNPKELHLVTDAFVPSKDVQWGNDFIGNQNDWNSNFGIAPMGIVTDDLICSQTITIKKYNETADNWEDYTSHFAYTPVTKKMPAGLWGSKPKSDLNDSQFVENAFAGLELVPGNSPTPGMSEVIDRSFVQYETDVISNVIEWEERDTFTNARLDEDTTIQTINTGIKENTNRDLLLESLGITGAVIDLTDTVANEYILAPQVMS